MKYILSIVLGLLLIVGCTEKELPEVEPPTVDIPLDIPKETPTIENLKIDNEAIKIITDKTICNEGATIGFMACNLLANTDVEVKAMHYGKDTLEGAEFYVYDQNKDMVAEYTEFEIVNAETETKYTLPIHKYADAYSVEIRPIIKVDGINKVCENQHIVVIPTENCR